MGILLPVAVVGYLRVRDQLSVCNGSFLLPSARSLPHWSVMLYPGELTKCSKTGQADETVALDSPRIQQLVLCLRDVRTGASRSSIDRAVTDRMCKRDQDGGTVVGSGGNGVPSSPQWRIDRCGNKLQESRAGSGAEKMENVFVDGKIREKESPHLHVGKAFGTAARPGSVVRKNIGAGIAVQQVPCRHRPARSRCVAVSMEFVIID